MRSAKLRRPKNICSPSCVDFRSRAKAAMWLDLDHMIRGEHIKKIKINNFYLKFKFNCVLYFLFLKSGNPTHGRRSEIFLFFNLFIFYYPYVHTMLGSFLSPASTPSLTNHPKPSHFPLLPRYLAETILPLSLILLKREYKQ
jgi:hypothetical protein